MFVELIGIFHFNQPLVHLCHSFSYQKENHSLKSQWNKRDSMNMAANVRNENYSQLIQDSAIVKSSTPNAFFFFFFRFTQNQ